MAECVVTGTMREVEQICEWKTPPYLGAKKPDHGELPLDHIAINKLSNPIHYIKNYKRELSNLVKIAKTKSETCKVDAMRLSKNLAYI
jgi:hypothetical protein